VSARPLVVIPAFNEIDCIADVIAEVRGAGYDCVVVNDASTDDTAVVAARLGVPVIDLPIQLGVGGALRAGFRYAVNHGYDRVVQVDADGQHPAEHIDALLRAVDELDADLVIGSRFAEGGDYSMSNTRRAAVGLLRRVAARSGAQVTDPTSGFRVIRAPLLTAFAVDFPHHYLGDTFEALLVAARRDYRVREIPLTMRPRMGGTPSADALALVKAMIRALTITFTGCSFDVPPRPPT
jgi:glycosyltransferase involved in cell wall biosynthesis